MVHISVFKLEKHKTINLNGFAVAAAPTCAGIDITKELS
ncbi:hypothetical protein D019_1602 [Vibrio parahaemolyticus VP2007-095]|nr:hypothetical protein D019_1602 [Vibrio parahaemolyticus VP2007-095]